MMPGTAVDSVSVANVRWVLSGTVVVGLHIAALIATLYFPGITDEQAKVSAGVIPVSFVSAPSPSATPSSAPEPGAPLAEVSPLPPAQTDIPAESAEASEIRDLLPDLPVVESTLAEFQASSERPSEEELPAQNEPVLEEPVTEEPESVADPEFAEETGETVQSETPSALNPAASPGATSLAPPTGPNNPDSIVEGAPGRTGAQLGDARDAWHSAVVAQLERYKDYPFMARRQRQEGVVLLAVSIDREGQVTSTVLLEGSQHNLLDKEALDLMQRVSSLPPPPAELPGEVFHLVVPIEFFLKG